jgi:hypothetical protein
METVRCTKFPYPDPQPAVQPLCTPSLLAIPSGLLAELFGGS